MCPIIVANVAEFPSRQPEHDASARWSEEHQLLDAIRSGDRSAAEEMVERTYSAVFASLFRLCADSDLAADLTQETYQKAWAALPKFDGRSQLFTWLYRIAYTTFLNHIRRPRRVLSMDDEKVPDVSDGAPSAEQMLAANEESERLRAAVLRLPEDLRFTVTAHFWGGLAVKEIARIEDITSVAIRKRLHKAFSLLEAILDED
ncbi:MAG TPA: sigma-70 family RNA polymerase sigma factor [Thermoanaerobaculia bacterium]|jgi:RNA polymerase sigma-70 factor (ECF subfamily)|nr:sigma-70 family RNA polymerase sigma factor [Thermoanaerobaculia bacterium]